MKIKIIFLITVLFLSFGIANAKTQKEEYQNDILYSEEYFNYIIEQASIEREYEIQQQKDLERLQKKSKTDKILEIKSENNDLEPQDEIIADEEFAPFKLRIMENITHPKYSESFKKTDTKTTIPVGDKFAFTQNFSKSRNKYSSTDYKILAGGEIYINKYFDIASGLETNYRGIDQNPQSRKIYFSPTVYFGEKLSLSFINKYNPQTRSSDHDLSLRVSPFKSKVLDFGIYSGITYHESGRHEESVSFSTNIYFK